MAKKISQLTSNSNLILIHKVVTEYAGANNRVKIKDLLYSDDTKQRRQYAIYKEPASLDKLAILSTQGQASGSEMTLIVAQDLNATFILTTVEILECLVLTIELMTLDQLEILLPESPQVELSFGHMIRQSNIVYT